MIIDTPGVKWSDPPPHPRAGDGGTNETRELEGGGAGNATKELEASRKYLEGIGLSHYVGLDMVTTVAKIVQPLHTFIVCDCSKPVASPQESLIEGICILIYIYMYIPIYVYTYICIYLYMYIPI
jgi:hypothetical protein